MCPVKDLDFVAGVPTRLGSAVFNITPHEDDNVVAKMRAGGLVFTGKTNTPELGLPCYTESEVAPPRAPRGISRVPLVGRAVGQQQRWPRDWRRWLREVMVAARFGFRVP